MTRRVDVVIVGAGPAGLAAATRACADGLDVLVVDNQPAPGGQVWKSIETMRDQPQAQALDADYWCGADPVERFRACGARYEPDTRIWQVEPGWRLFLSRDGRSTAVDAKMVLLVNGAQERPVPFPGWTLPGVHTVGAAQTLLKTSGQIPQAPVWIAGSGPLTLLYATQIVALGGQLDGILDTTPAANWPAALPHLPKALVGWRDLLKGLGWIVRLRRRGVRFVPSVDEIEAVGTAALEGVRYRSRNGRWKDLAVAHLLVHEGVIPRIDLTMALGCDHVWNKQQLCFTPKVDPWGETSVPGLFVAGDAAVIGGMEASRLAGEIAALGIATRLGRLEETRAEQISRPLRRRLSTARAPRPFLDRLYRPRRKNFVPDDDTIVCRCEEITAGDIRRAADLGRPGPNQVKTYTRAGMGPCQGRQCGYSVSHILAAQLELPIERVGFFRGRPPFEPITLGELAAMEVEEASLPREGDGDTG